MKSRSLLSTVLLRLIAVTVVTLLATVALLIWQFDRATGVVIDAGLQDMLDAVPQHLGFDAAGRPVADLPPAIENRLDEDYFIAVTDRDGRAYFSVPPGREHAFHPFEPDRTDKPQYFEHRYTESAHTYLGVTQHLVIEGRDIWLQVVEEVPYWKTLAFYSIELFVQGVAVLVIAHLLISASCAIIPCARRWFRCRRRRPKRAGSDREPTICGSRRRICPRRSRRWPRRRTAPSTGCRPRSKRRSVSPPMRRTS